MRALRGWDAAPPGEAEVESIVNASLPHLPRKKTARVRPLVTHAAALFVGVAITGWGHTACYAEPPERPDAKVVTRLVEVPVEVPVEKRVEIPVEVIIERIVTRDRLVPHPLQARHDVEGRLIASLADMGASALALSHALVERTEGRPSISTTPSPAAVASRAPTPKARTVGNGRTGLPEPALEVVRDGDRVILRTNGSMQQVVPALLRELGGPDEAVASSALVQLERIRAGLGDGAVRLATPRSRAPRDEAPGGIRALWHASNQRRSGSEGDATLVESTRLEIWRDWWSRQRTSLGLIAETTTY